MSSVYEVEHLKLGVRRALKTFTLASSDAAFLKSRFLAEARTLARIDHPHVARVFDLDILPDGTAYFVMDLVLDPDGEPLTLADAAPDDFSDDDRWRWMTSIASALDFIHDRGIVHRDVKLSNILVDARRDAVLVDFGISRYERGDIKRQIGVERTVIAGEGEDAKRLVMGTGGYLAPELLRGEDATAASDVYALGVAFFRLLTGMWYEPGTNALRLVDPIGGVWADILPAMLDPDPSKRPQPLLPYLEQARRRLHPPRTPLASRPTLLAAALATLLAAAAVWLAAPRTQSPRTSTTSTTAAPTTSAASPAADAPRPSADLSFDLGEGVRLELVHCRPKNLPPYWIGASHVTNAEWARIMGEGANLPDDRPVCGMSLGGIRRFLDELNRRFASRLPKGMAFRLPTERELVAASTADGANAADASVLGVLGPAVADKRALAREAGESWQGMKAKLPCRVRTKPPNAYGLYDVVGQGRTICADLVPSPGDAAARHLQLGPDDLATRSTVGEWGWNTTLRLAIGGN